MTTEDWIAHEERWLAPYAMRSARSLGRRHPEPPHPYRAPYARDRERIVHSSAFRRMTGKTQVLVASVNDHHRTRLTHTLEVTQVARTVARRLRLNEDLTEVIALAHDIGHPPFGHAGEEALNICLMDYGGFDHNLYGLRRVDELEERYPEYPGLNLTAEVREAFVRHSRKSESPESIEFAGYGSPLLEAQVVDAVDSIAYNTHDLDDALGLGFISPQDLSAIEIWKRASETVHRQYGRLSDAAHRTAVVRELLAWQVSDLITSTVQRIEQMGIRTLDDVRNCKTQLVVHGDELKTMKQDLENFLQTRVYRHYRVLRMTANGKRILTALFQEYNEHPELLPERHLSRWSQFELPMPALPGRQRVAELPRVIGDYLAGMTDRFAQQEYRRLFYPAIDF